MIAAKAPTQKLQLQFARYAQDAIAVKRDLHEKFFLLSSALRLR